METQKKKVLIVEDDVALCSLVAGILEKDYDVTECNNSIDAWQWLSDGNSPNLVITDFKMPLIDGLEFVENIKTSGLYRDVPVVILSGNNDANLKERCEELGIKAFLVKPFSPKLLLETTEESIKSTSHAY